MCGVFRWLSIIQINNFAKGIISKLFIELNLGRKYSISIWIWVLDKISSTNLCSGSTVQGIIVRSYCKKNQLKRIYRIWTMSKLLKFMYLNLNVFNKFKDKLYCRKVFYTILGFQGHITCNFWIYRTEDMNLTS
jgi:hypothetical protein